MLNWIALLAVTHNQACDTQTEQLPIYCLLTGMSHSYKDVLAIISAFRAHSAITPDDDDLFVLYRLSTFAGRNVPQWQW